MDDGDGELNDALEGFVYFGESAIEHICLKYHNCDVNTLNDLAELAEKVLELCVLLEDVIGGDVVETFREFVWTLTHERDRRSILGRGRPEIAMGEINCVF